MTKRLEKLKSLKAPAAASVEQAQTLRSIVEELRDGLSELETLGAMAADVHGRVLNRVRLQGLTLCRAKVIAGHGKFAEFVERTFKGKVTIRTAQNWMRAAKWSEANAKEFSLLSSVAQLYVVAGILPEPEQIDIKTEPTFSLAVALRYVRPLAHLDRTKVLALAPAERDELRAALAPAHELYVEMTKEGV